MELFSSLEKDTEPTSLRWALSFAHGYFELGMLSAAEREINQLSVRHRCYADVIELRVRILLRQKRFEKAAWLAKSAAKVYPGVSDFYELAGEAYEALGRPDEAKAVWVSAPSLFHVSGIFHYNIARFEVKLGNHLSAREHIALAIELDPDMLTRMEEDPGFRDFFLEQSN